MNTLSKIGCRIYQQSFHVSLALGLLPYRQPKIIDGGLKSLPAFIKSKNIKKVLLITDVGLAKLGLANPLIEDLKKEGIECSIFDETVPNPTINNIENALKIYNENNCEALIAFGGGSPMDCTKGVAARVARPKKQIPQMKGLIKIRKTTPTIFAVPTTSGTGSETTLTAVISNSETHEKYPLNDFVLIPKYAVLDPSITVGLPKHITSTTGMDALTHAVEAYIGSGNTKQTKTAALKAVKLIFENLEKAYEDGSNLEARKNMQIASYEAGVAFTMSYVGYVHAIAHSLGGFYGTPHGLANSVLLPILLEEYGSKAWKKLAQLADHVGITEEGDTVATKATKFISAIKQMNKNMGIPEKFDFIKEEDIPVMSKRANSEANPLYPVPKLMDTKALAKIYYKVSSNL